MEAKAYPPIELLKDAIKRYPNVWETLNAMHKDNGINLPAWDRRCYVPIAGTVAVVTKGANSIEAARNILMSNQGNAWIAILAALAPWRRAKEVYRFDKDFEEMLYSQAGMENDIPSIVFETLPYDCVYIESPHLAPDMHGFFTHFEYDVKKRNMELRLLFVSNELDIHPWAFHLNTKTIDENWEITMQESLEVAFKVKDKKFVKDLAKINEIAKNSPSEIEDKSNIYTKALSLVLYICAENAEIVQSPESQKKQTKKTKRQLKTIKDRYKEIRHWDVGERIGRIIRASKNYEEAPRERTSREGQIEQQKKRPHTRRGHWHHYWTGSRTKPDTRKLILRWVAPIFIGKISDDNPMVINIIKE